MLFSLSLIHVALTRDSLELSHAYKNVWAINQYVRTDDQLPAWFAKVIDTFFVVQLSVVYIFSIKNTQFSSFLKKFKTGLKWLRVNQ